MKKGKESKNLGVLLGAPINNVVLPGDVVGVVPEAQQNQQQEHQTTVSIGPGLRQQQSKIVVAKPGILRFKPPNKYWIDNTQKRYVPIKDERIIGVVSDKLGENYKVDIGAAVHASLDSMAFEGATKKNRPNLQVGSLIYARLLVANKDMEPQLTCVDAYERASGMGELVGGYMATCSIGLCRKLLNHKCAVLTALGKYFPFEVTVGMNGRVWINSPSAAHTVVIVNAVLNSEFMSDKQAQTMVETLAASLS